MSQGYQMRGGVALRPIALRDRFAVPFLFLYVVLNIVPGLFTIQDSKVYFGQIVISGVIVATFVSLIGRARKLSLPIFLIIVGILVVLPFVSNGIYNDRFLNEQIKLLLVVLGSVAVSHRINWRSIDAMSAYFPSIMVSMALITSVLGMGQYYGEEGRFGVPLLGSPNSTAYAFCASLVFALNAILAFPRWRLINTILALVLAGIIVWTDSDGGILMLIFIFIAYSWLSLKNLITAAVLTFIFSLMALLYLPQFEIPELIGSGRLYIWKELLHDLSGRSFLIKLVGVGPGGIELNLYFTKVVISAHSTYIEILYSYGIIGLLVFLSILTSSIKFLSKEQFPKRQQKFLNAILIMNVVGGLVDTYIFTAQLVWLGGILFGILLFAWQTAMHDQRAAMEGRFVLA